MLKSVITATALLAVAGGSYVYAEQSFGDFRFGDRLRAEYHHRPSAADVSAFADARFDQDLDQGIHIFLQDLDQE